MDFDLSDDQLALRDTARELLADLASSARVRAFTESNDLFDRRLWDALVEQGWLQVDASTASGGLGLGTVEVAVLLEELGAHAAPVPWRSTMLAAAVLDRAGNADESNPLRDGDRFACVAWSRRADAVRASVVGGEWSLTGRPDPVVDGPIADLALVVALDESDEPGLFVAELASTQLGGPPRREPAMDVTRSVGWLDFESTPVRRLGGAGTVDEVLDRGAAYVCAEMLGGAQAVLDQSVSYAKDRVQFGRPIGSFQAVKHRCADMLVDVEGMRSSAYWAAWAIGAGDDDPSVAASTAKIWGSDASRRVMSSGLQVHGGIGFTWEHDLHFFLKRAQLDQLTFGDAGFHRRRLAAMLRAKVDAGLSVV